MPFYLVTTRFPEPIEAPDPDRAEFLAENQGFGLVEVVEVEKVKGSWRPTGVYTNLANMPRTANLHLHEGELPRLAEQVNDLVTGAAPYFELRTVLDGIPLNLRVMRD